LVQLVIILDSMIRFLSISKCFAKVLISRLDKSVLLVLHKQL